MIVSSNGKKPKIHASAYVAPSATIAGDVTIGSGCAILHGAVIVSEGAPVTIGTDTVVMENAVIKASGKALKFPLIARGTLHRRPPCVPRRGGRSEKAVS